jgi:hypothetical protein
MAHKVRLAQRGWHHESAAKTAEEVEVGVDLLWVEIDGHRFSDVVSAEYRIAEGVNVPVITVEVIGPVEIVYLDKDGNEFEGVTSTVKRVPEMFEHGRTREVDGA